MSTLKQRTPYAKIFVILCMTLMVAGWLTRSEVSSMAPSEASSLQAGNAIDDRNDEPTSTVTISDAVITRGAETLEFGLSLDGDGGTYVLLDEQMPLPQGSGEHKYYYANSGNNLRQVIQTLRKQKYESAVGFRITGEKLYDYTNFLPSMTYATTKHRQAFINQGGTLSIHNHPSNCPFSADDLHSEAKLKTPITMVVSDRYVYTAQPKSGDWGDPDALKVYYSKQIAKYQQAALNYMASINYSYSPDKILSAAPRPDDGSFKWFYENEIRQHLLAGKSGNVAVSGGIWSMDKAMRQTAKKFNLLYTRVETDKFRYNSDFFTPVAQPVQTAYTYHYLSVCIPVWEFGGKNHPCLPPT